MPTLTPAQQAVVAHDQGAALVFAAAGSGKTTTLVHRIARLVQGGARPEQILATSFNRAAADDIQRALNRLGVKGVESRTLHSLGYTILAEGVSQGLLTTDLRKAKVGAEGLSRTLLSRALAEARKRKLPFVDELNRLEMDDFLDYLARCKGNLAYADLADRRLPGASVATQATAPEVTPWYLDLYRLHESIRQGLGWLTFDDLLMEGWAALVTHPPLLHTFQSRYRYLLVDEFQDVNLAQAELVDLISRSHGNLMVIGDDDQTIYEWRGAAPRFILGFEARYQAQVYLLQENFRCRASHIALANQIIRHNPERAAKQLVLTQGMGGSTTLHLHPDSAHQAGTILAQIQAALAQGHPPQEVAVLVRLYAQTPSIEAGLLAAGVPYRLEGEQPFYQRPELAVLLDYLALASLEAKLLAGDPLTAPEREELGKVWVQVVNRPQRYIARALWEGCLKGALEQGVPLSQGLAQYAEQAPVNVDERMRGLSGDLAWLAQRVGQVDEAAPLLRELSDRLRYGEILARQGGSGFLGQARATGLDAFLRLPQPGERWRAFRRRCQQMAHRPAPSQAVNLTTIFRAKGLEWPVVIVPDCNQGVLPYERATNLAEERRLLYVAVTRSREHLHLHALSQRPLSDFLLEAQVEQTLSQVAHMARTLTKPARRWSANDRAIMTQHAQPLGLYPYIAQQTRLPVSLPSKEQPVPFARTRRNSAEIWGGIQIFAQFLTRLFRRP
jgi:DNA helicase-2/ATP-dependent DNA helicase PcrA